VTSKEHEGSSDESSVTYQGGRGYVSQKDEGGMSCCTKASEERHQVGVE